MKETIKLIFTYLMLCFLVLSIVTNIILISLLRDKDDMIQDWSKKREIVCTKKTYIRAIN